MARDDDIEAIVEHGRRTRKKAPRWLWIAATIIGVVCAAGFVIMLLADPAPGGAVRRAGPEIRARSGLGTGLVIGVVVGIVIGFALGRQRSHSSRNNP